MVGSIGVPIVDYTLAVKNQDHLLGQFQKSPGYAQAVAYYQANIGKGTSVDALLKDRKLLTVAPSAFQLESEGDAQGLPRQLLTADPAASTQGSARGLQHGSEDGAARHAAPAAHRADDDADRQSECAVSGDRSVGDSGSPPGAVRL